MNITRTEYITEIEALAESIFDGSYDYMTMEPYEALHETVDGHEWVIYTRYHHEILSLSDNRDAASDEGFLQEGAPFSSLVMTSAFCALERDVMDTPEWDEAYALWEKRDDILDEARDAGETVFRDVYIPELAKAGKKVAAKCECSDWDYVAELVGDKDSPLFDLAVKAFIEGAQEAIDEWGTTSE